MSRPTKAYIDLAALRHNYAIASRLSAPGQALPIVKANGYGHGAVPIAQALEPLAPAFGVACIEEALELREAGIAKPILLLEGAFSADELQTVAQHGLWSMVCNQTQSDAVLKTPTSRPLRLWLKIDTGMHRLGIAPDETVRLYSALRACPHVDDEIVLATHFACADDLNSPFTLEQMRRFEAATRGLQAPRSLTNSAGLLGWPQARSEWNRPGFMLYGNSPFAAQLPAGEDLRPVMTLKSAIISISEVPTGESVGYAALWSASRPSRVATLAIGYGDGYPVNTPYGTPVLLRGQRVPVVGRVSMDMTTIDVTDLPEAAIGDEVTLWGEGLALNEVARHIGTLSYELITRMPARIPRIYQG